uniref:cyclin dependent kinase inhibitor 1Ca n=1 Tax=Semicossyphus pulcher TaxID=241346 RepID=UPI0037E744EA
MDPLRRRESVCRSLFGPVDHEQLRRDLKQRLKEIAEQDSRRWNFNFQTDTPMCGRFQWEEIPADCAATVYQESTELKDKVVCSPNKEDDNRLSDREESAKTDQENCSSISNTPKCPAEVTPVRGKRTHSKCAAKPRNNARITDFFAKRRRSTETKSILNPFHTSSSEAAPCKTIR